MEMCLHYLELLEYPNLGDINLQTLGLGGTFFSWNHPILSNNKMGKYLIVKLRNNVEFRYRKMD